MFKLICILNYVILVTSNPLQGLTCPLVIYQRNYGQPEVPQTQPSNFNPYQQQHIVQNQLAPTYQTIPYLNNDQIRETYLNKVLTNPSINSFVDPNTRIFDQNGLEITRYISNPTGAQPNVVNNYIIVPPEYFRPNQSIANENKYNKSLKLDNHKKNVKSKREESKTTDTYDRYIENKPVGGKLDNHVSKKNIKSQDDQVNNKKRKSSRNNESSNTLESPNVAEDDNIAQKPKKHKTRRSKKNLDVEKNENNKRNEEQKASTKDDGNSNRSKTVKKKPKGKKKTKSTPKNAVESQLKNEMYDDTNLKEKPKDNPHKTADVEVCFDINEDCASLENRRTRNNCYQQKNNYQQYYPRDFSENIASYLNNIMSNQQFNFNPFGYPPYNFNYLYQIPQQISSRSNGSNKKRKNKRKKQKSNKGSKSNTEQQNSNKSQDQEVISNGCEKIVELAPQFIEIEETIEPSISQEPTNNSEKIPDEIEKEIETKELEPVQTVPEPPEYITEPLTLYENTDSKESLYVAPLPNQEDYFSILNYNDVLDEYFPDFRSDNTYLSKEEYECNNFHDRHYYTSDNKAETSKETRYKHVDGKKLRNFNDVFNNEHELKIKKEKNDQRRKDNKKNIENSSEVKFRTPPPLEFPDFKTEMINKDRYNSRSEIYDQPDSDQNCEMSSHIDMKASKNVELYKHHENEVETVYAQSKVIKYGAKPNIEETSLIFDMTEPKSDDKNLFSTDGETTVIIARSLGYPDYL